MKTHLFITIRCPYIGIEAQLLSQVAIDRGDNVTFPMNDNNIPVKSRVPNPTISMQNYIANSTTLYLLQENILDQFQIHFCRTLFFPVILMGMQ